MNLSIIVPVYNVEEYIAECIDSILAQTYKDWELILVDDGSKDNSGKICDEYALKDNRIKVIHKENGGAASARNKGLENAFGQYITFIDGDDVLLNNNIYEKILKIFVNDNTIDIVQYDVIHNWKSAKEHRRKYPFNDYYSKVDIADAFLNSNIHMSCCDKIFRRDIFNKVKFPDCKICEDISIIPLWIENINKIKCTDIGYYGYRHNEKSTSKSFLTYDKLIGISDAYYKYLAYTFSFEKLKSKSISIYVNNIWDICSNIRINYPHNINEFCNKKFFIRTNFKDWLQISKELPLILKIKSYIGCVLGPKWIFKFQNIFTQNK